MPRVRHVRIPSLRIVERDDEPPVVTMLKTLWTSGMALDEADDARDGLPEPSDGRPDGPLHFATGSAFPGNENDVGYLAHRVKVLAGQALWVDTGANARGAIAARRSRRPE